VISDDQIFQLEINQNSLRCPFLTVNEDTDQVNVTAALIKINMMLQV